MSPVANAFSVVVADDPSASRYELLVDGVLAATANYSLTAGRIEFIYTELLPGFEGRGLGAQFAGDVLDNVRSRELVVVTHCVFFKTFIEDHPSYGDLIGAPALRAAGA